MSAFIFALREVTWTMIVVTALLIDDDECMDEGWPVIRVV
jgi:hypothetical protein